MNVQIDTIDIEGLEAEVLARLSAFLFLVGVGGETGIQIYERQTATSISLCNY